MTAVNIALNAFPTRQALAESLSSRVATTLADAIARRGKAVLAVSGGTTPALFFRTLSEADIDWPRVTVTLVDERFVPEDSPRSNAGLARANLLVGKAAAARFVGLYRAVPTADEAAALAEGEVEALGLPFDAVILGMGNDGHTASFFPDAPTLGSLLDPGNPVTVAPVDAPSGGEPRLTLTLAPIIGARLLVLHIEGDGKRAVLDSVLGGADLPISHVLRRAPRPVEVFWAP